MNLDARKQAILSTITEIYVDTGEPVSSKSVEKVLSLSVSSATIRNDMAKLMDLGYIKQPHTSAGRIPSDMGYKYYIKYLMKKQELTTSEKQMILKPLKMQQYNIDSILETASNILAVVTNYASISTTPSSNNVYSRIELVPTGNKIVVLLVLTSDGGVKNQVCRLDFEPTEESYNIFVKTLNEKLSHTPTSKITEDFFNNLIKKLSEELLIFAPVLFALYNIVDEVTGGEVILDGQINLFNHKELSENTKIILEFLDEQEGLKKLLDTQNSSSISVLLGDDIINYSVPDMGIVMNRYFVSDITGGTLGVIGPSRMNYKKTIPYVEYISDTVSYLLTDAVKNKDDFENATEKKKKKEK